MFPECTHVHVKVNNLLAISESDFDNSGELGPQAEGVNHLETPLRQLQVTHRASSCAKRGGHVQLCSKPRGARGIEPETFRRRGQLLSRPPTTGPKRSHARSRCLVYNTHARTLRLVPHLGWDDPAPFSDCVASIPVYLFPSALTRARTGMHHKIWRFCLFPYLLGLSQPRHQPAQPAWRLEGCQHTCNIHVHRLC